MNWSPVCWKGGEGRGVGGRRHTPVSNACPASRSTRHSASHPIAGADGTNLFEQRVFLCARELAVVDLEVCVFLLRAQVPELDKVITHGAALRLAPPSPRERAGAGPRGGCHLLGGFPPARQRLLRNACAYIRVKPGQDKRLESLQPDAFRSLARVPRLIRGAPRGGERGDARVRPAGPGLWAEAPQGHPPPQTRAGQRIRTHPGSPPRAGRRPEGIQQRRGRRRGP